MVYSILITALATSALHLAIAFIVDKAENYGSRTELFERSLDTYTSKELRKIIFLAETELESRFTRKEKKRA